GLDHPALAFRDDPIGVREHERSPPGVVALPRSEQPRDGEHQRWLAMLRADPRQDRSHVGIRRDAGGPFGVHVTASRGLVPGEPIEALTHGIRHDSILGAPERLRTRDNGDMSYTVNKTEDQWREELG